MNPIDNSALLGYNKNYDYSAFQPGATFVYDSTAKTVTVTDNSVIPAGDTLKVINVSVHDAFGGTARGHITQLNSAVTALLAITAAKLTAKNNASDAKTTADDAATAADAAFAGDNTSTDKAAAKALADQAATNADAAYTAALNDYNTAKAASDAAVADAHNLCEIDVSGLDPVKGLNITATVITDKGYTGNGSAYMIGANGSLGTWNKAQTAAESATAI